MRSYSDSTRIRGQGPFSYIYEYTYKLCLKLENFEMLSNGNWRTSTFSLSFPLPHSIYLFLLLFLLSTVLETEKSFEVIKNHYCLIFHFKITTNNMLPIKLT